MVFDTPRVLSGFSAAVPSGSGSCHGRCRRLSGRRIVNLMVKSPPLDQTFAALSDPMRRAMLERLSLGPATISELAEPTGISLPGVLKHIRVLEEVDLVTSEKKGRSRECRMGPSRLDDAIGWIEWYRSQWGRRLDRLEAYLERRKGGPG